jgi:hypothetical protein
VKLAIKGTEPQQCLVRVGLAHQPDYPVGPDGLVVFTVPAFRHTSDVYLFDVIKMRDGSAEHVRIIQVHRGERLLRRLSLAQIASLPKDGKGYAVVHIGD